MKPKKKNDKMMEKRKANMKSTKTNCVKFPFNCFLGYNPYKGVFWRKRNCPKYKVLEVVLLDLEHLFLRIAK